MGPEIVVVLHGCCPTRTHALAVALQEEMSSRKLNVKVVEAEFTSCGYWDGVAKVFVSPSPVFLDLATPVVLIRDTFNGTSQDGARSLMPEILSKLAGAVPPGGAAK